MTDWVEQISLTQEYQAEHNPHYYCSSQSTKPCPTGEHQNPLKFEEWEEQVLRAYRRLGVRL
jgi:hypothetical protein